MIKTIIELKDVCYQYPSEGKGLRDVLKGINISIYPGEYVALIGKNGSGKSTLTRLLNALLTPTKGMVKIDGMCTSEHANQLEIRKKVGMIFQNPDNQIIANTVQDEVAFGLENIGVPPSEMQERIHDALKLVGLSGVEKKEPHHLSGGQKQRLAIASVIAMNPDILIFDEATSMLDPQGKQQILHLITELHQQNKTIIHVTHSLQEAFKAERLLMISDGEMQMDMFVSEWFSFLPMLKSQGWVVPSYLDLYNQLLRQGWKMRKDISSIQDMGNEIWKYVLKN